MVSVAWSVEELNRDPLSGDVFIFSKSASHTRKTFGMGSQWVRSSITNDLKKVPLKYPVMIRRRIYRRLSWDQAGYDVRGGGDGKNPLS